MNTDVRILLTVSEAAEQLRVGKSHLYGLIRTGELRTIKLGKARGVPVSALNDLVDRLLQQEENV